MEDDEEITVEQLAQRHWFVGLLLTEEEMQRIVKARLGKKADFMETRPGLYRDIRFHPTPKRTWATITEVYDLDLSPDPPQVDSPPEP